MSNGMNGHAAPDLLQMAIDRIIQIEEQLSAEEFEQWLRERPGAMAIYVGSIVYSRPKPKVEPPGIPGTLSEFYRAPEKPAWAMRMRE